MQLLEVHPTLVTCDRNPKEPEVDIKEKQSNASLLLMNPVASGDNVATGLASAHKLKEELPPLVPCCEGRELRINEDLVRSGLSAISVKHDNVTQCLSSSIACERVPTTPGLVKHRNSYRCLHRPDLKRVPYLRRLTPDELELLFRGHADFPSRTLWSDSVQQFVHLKRVPYLWRLTPDELELLFRGHADFPSRTLWSDNQENTSRVLPPDENVRKRDLRTKENTQTDEDGIPLHPILESRSGVDDIPVGMRLHGTRGRLYTSVLAGVTAGDQLSGDLIDDAKSTDDFPPEDEVQLSEDLQIILPPRCDDVTDSAISNATTSSYR